jgi:hypothetical protein
MNTQFIIMNLNQFTGTENYYPISPKHSLTDGTRYLADNANCYWLMYAITSHLRQDYQDNFAVAKLVVEKQSAHLTLDDGNGSVFANQLIEYTDFPNDSIKLYCVFNGAQWIIMLPSEY